MYVRNKDNHGPIMGRPKLGPPIMIPLIRDGTIQTIFTNHASD
jgi:hypothetical protein